MTDTVIYDNRRTLHREIYHDGILKWSVVAAWCGPNKTYDFIGTFCEKPWGTYPDYPHPTPPDLPATQDIEQQPWTHIEEILPTIKSALAKEWWWMYNPRCKYIHLRIDMRDGGCILQDRNGEKITPDQLRYQWRQTPMT